MGIGKKFNEANDQIVRLCSNLDAVDGIVTVQDPDNIEELYQHIPFPDEGSFMLKCLFSVILNYHTFIPMNVKLRTVSVTSKLLQPIYIINYFRQEKQCFPEL